MNARHDPSAFIPQSLEAEQALLGAILLRNDAYLTVADVVESDHFYEQVHATLYGLLGERILRGENMTPVTLGAALGKDAVIDIAEGVTVSKYLARLASEAIGDGGLPLDYAKTIRDLWARRRIITLARDIQNRALGGVDDDGVEALLDEADRELASIRFGKSVDGIVTMAEAVTTSIDQTARAFQGGVSIGLSTGINAIDGMTGPLMPGDLITLLGASGHGKTALTAQFLKYNAMPSLDAHQGSKRALFFSMEMEGAAIARRVLASETGYSAKVQKSGDILPAELEFLIDAGRKLSNLPILFDQTPGQTVSRIMRKARAIKNRYPDLAIIAVDHLLEIRPENPRWSKVETAENAIQELKRLAKELRVVLFVLAQATREGQKRDHWRLRTNDIYGGDRVKQSSDFVLALGIPSVWLGEREPDVNDQKDHDRWLKQCADWVGKAEVGAPKVRDGESGSWRAIAFDGKRTVFGDL